MFRHTQPTEASDLEFTCLIPLNLPARRKSRLSGVLSPERRLALSERLHAHVLQSVREAAVANVHTLMPPDSAATGCWRQQHEDLNLELDRLRTQLAAPLLVINADLPLLEPADVVALARAAKHSGCAIAADRHGRGTNAVALLPGGSFAFAFGMDSLARHRSSAPGAVIVHRPGLSFDLDTPADVRALITRAPAAWRVPLAGEVAYGFDEDRGTGWQRRRRQRTGVSLGSRRA